MHGGVEENLALIQQLLDDKYFQDKNFQMGICPVTLHIPQVADLIQKRSHILLGAQNANEHQSGAFTGEVSAKMLAEYGVNIVLLGHSERRTLFAETDALIAAKFKAVIEQQLTPVLCIGESLAQREQEQTESVILAQLETVLDKVGRNDFANCIIAYEPIWAIGTGETATPDQAQCVHHCIRQWLHEKLGNKAATMSIIYGGSVKPDNAETLFSQEDIDGGLIGGASLDAKSFIAICAAAQ